MAFVAAALQMRSTRSVERNTADLLALAEEAVARGARYLQSPEMSNILERSREALFAAIRPEAEDPMLAAVRAFAKAKGIFFHLGSLALREGEKVANRALLVAPDGEIRARYDKLHLFDVDLPHGESWRESAIYNAGAFGTITPCVEGMLGLAICYDLRFPYLFRSYAMAGAEILSAPACFTRQTGAAHWAVLQRARAIENAAFMISAAQGGSHEDGRESFGHSIIVDPWGRVLAEAGDTPTVITAEIDLALVAEARARIPTLHHGHKIMVERMGE